ncbi:MAG: hypothetical protein ABEJ36_02420 [Candidatus Nanosalina sp.]
MSFLLDFMEKLKPGGEESEGDSRGFPDMNYVVGNTSGLDVGNIPTPIAQRVGDQAQIGGSVMEVQIYNPSTFQVDREELISTINQLGIDISVHSEPNSGFASAYRTRGQQAQGYKTVHNYFSSYLNQLAIFKRTVENMQGVDFDITRINPHISTSPLPALEERMASDVGLDPFGFQINEMTEEVDNRRSEASQNIYENDEFLRRLYYTFFVEEVDFAFQYYNLFSRYSNKFDQEWEDVQRGATNEYYDWKTEEEPDNLIDGLQEKIALLRTAQMQDRGIDTVWLDIIDDAELDNPIPTFSWDEEEGELNKQDDIEDLQELVGSLREFRSLSQELHQFQDDEEDFILENIISAGGPMQQGVPEEAKEAADYDERWAELVKEGVKSCLDELWKGNGEEKISIDAKIQALNSHFDIQQMKIQELAYENNAETMDKRAEKVFMGRKDYFIKEGPEEQVHMDKHQQMLRNLFQNFEQQMWMESSIFYKIMPAWMKNSNAVNNSKHEGWEAPEFIWETLVENKWGDEFDLDLTNPDDPGGYFDALEKEEFRMDVAAAVSACYVWGHYTQKKSHFEISGEEYVEDEEGDYTWMEWMNRYGIGVNLEAMHGDPQQLLKIWRPKDIVTAARAINITARNELGEIHPELDECIAKFTIDMEHTASFGVDPWKEMKRLIEQEEDLAKREDHGAIVDHGKPLAKIMRNYHLMKPGLESQQGTRHGPFDRGDTMLYTWLYRLVEAGFARNPNEEAAIMYEQGEEKAETTYMARISMDLIELGVEPEELDPVNVSTDGDYDSREEALIAKFFGIDEASTSVEWAKIEEHAFDPLQGLLEAEEFDYTFSSGAAVQNDNRPNEWKQEEYK